jgi:hypothetical protein
LYTISYLEEWQFANVLIELRTSSSLPRCSKVTGNSKAIRELPVKSQFEQVRFRLLPAAWANLVKTPVTEKFEAMARRFAPRNAFT